MATPTPSPEIIAKLKLIGLDDKNAQDLSGNVEKSTDIIGFFEANKVYDAEPKLRMMIYNMITKLKPNQCRDVGAQYVLQGKIKTTPQAEAATRYLSSLAGPDKFAPAAFEKESGVGADATPEEIKATVSDALSKFKDAIVSQRYQFNSGQVLGALKKVTNNVRWVEGSVVKAEVDKQIFDLIGPRTEADDVAATAKPAKKEAPAAAPKEEKKPKAAAASLNPESYVIEKERPIETLFQLNQLFDRDAAAIDGLYTKIYGWIRRTREAAHGTLAFIDVYDGTVVGELKGIAAQDTYLGPSYIDKSKISELSEASTYKILAFPDLLKAESLSEGCAVVVEGKVVKSPPSATQKYELQIVRLRVIGGVGDPEKYPINKSSTTQITTLRQMPFFRVRAQAMQSIFRVCSKLELAVHTFMDMENVEKTDPNIVTNSDCEGAGETFAITPQMFSTDSQGNAIPVGLTVSSQLPLEALITGLKRVYTAQKSFRAEKSDTYKHLAEFYHIEAELAGITMDELLSFTERMVKFVIKFAFDRCAADLDFLASKLAPEDVNPPKKLLAECQDRPFCRIKHCDAVTLINKLVSEGYLLPEADKTLKPATVKELPKPGEDLGAEHERLLVKYFGWISVPEDQRQAKLLAGDEFGAFVFLTHWPLKIKSFYMKQCDDGSGESESFDLLAPRVGELFGGSMREWRFDKLDAEIKRRGMNVTPIQWFIDLRKSGSMPHGGWGMGFARLCTLVTGAPTVRDVVCFPVYYGHCPY